MCGITVDGDSISFDGTTVVVRRPVDEWLVADGVVVVLLDVPLDELDNRNVLGFSTAGERLWEIDPISSDPTADQPYLSLFESEGGVWVSNPIGARCRLDTDTGEFVETRQRKW